MIQTTKTANIYFPDGAKVSIKESGASVFTDIGALSTDVTATLNYDENQVETANAGKLQKRLKNMTVAGGFTLINLDPVGVGKMGGGLFTVSTVAGSATTSVDNQVLANGSVVDKGLNNLVLIDSNNTLRATAEPTITSVTGSVDGALTANDDYEIVPDANSYSGYSIIFNTAGSTLTTVAQDFTIDFNSVTPVAKTVVYAGSSTATLDAYAMRIAHTDGNGKVRQLDLYSVDANSGGFQFNFKGANSDGTEEMPLQFTAKLDSSQTDGQQLLAWSIDDGAE